jgi:deoxyribodipyrimidine photo-lyase
VFGKHDRAWSERPVYGKVRYMAASGLERKCDIRAYVLKVDNRVRRIKADHDKRLRRIP